MGHIGLGASLLAGATKTAGIASWLSALTGLSNNEGGELEQSFGEVFNKNDAQELGKAPDGGSRLENSI